MAGPMRLPGTDGSLRPEGGSPCSLRQGVILCPVADKSDQEHSAGCGSAARASPGMVVWGLRRSPQTVATLTRHPHDPPTPALVGPATSVRTLGRRQTPPASRKTAQLRNCTRNFIAILRRRRYSYRQEGFWESPRVPESAPLPGPQVFAPPTAGVPMPTRRVHIAVLITLTALAQSPHVFADEAPTGEQIFRTKCASCHGMNGEGVKGHYAKPLSRRSLRGPARPGHRRDHAQGRSRNVRRRRRRQGRRLRLRRLLLQDGRARIDLSRLTVRQHQNAVADLIAELPLPRPVGRPARLRGEYFGNRHFGDRVLERLDAECTSTSRPTAPTRRSSRKSSRSAGKGRSSPRRPAITSSSSAPRTASGSGSTTTSVR